MQSQQRCATTNVSLAVLWRVLPRRPLSMREHGSGGEELDALRCICLCAGEVVGGGSRDSRCELSVPKLPAAIVARGEQSAMRGLTPELSRTAARHGGVVHVTALSRAAKRSRLERIVRPQPVVVVHGHEAPNYCSRTHIACRFAVRRRMTCCRQQSLVLGTQILFSTRRVPRGAAHLVRDGRQRRKCGLDLLR